MKEFIKDYVFNVFEKEFKGNTGDDLRNFLSENVQEPYEQCSVNVAINYKDAYNLLGLIKCKSIGYAYHSKHSIEMGVSKTLEEVPCNDLYNGILDINIDVSNISLSNVIGILKEYSSEYYCRLSVSITADIVLAKVVFLDGELECVKNGFEQLCLSKLLSMCTLIRKEDLNVFKPFVRI